MRRRHILRRLPCLYRFVLSEEAAREFGFAHAQNRGVRTRYLGPVRAIVSRVKSSTSSIPKAI